MTGDQDLLATWAPLFCVCAFTRMMLLLRHYCAFADITHDHNAREFLARLVERRIATPYAAVHARARLCHIHRRAA